MADNNKIAIVTGAARGIGLEIVKRLLADDVTVVAVDLNAELLAQLPETLGQPGDKLETKALDVTDADGFAAMVDETAEKHGSIDILVNNAGITRDGLLMRMSDEDWNLVLNVNLTSAFIGTRAVCRYMVRQKSGSIINMASYSGVEGNRGQANYAASKAGMIGLTKTTAKELAGKSIRCNAVAPGFIQTEMTDVLPQQAKDMALAQIPLKRFGQPADIACAVAFLARDESNYITGQVLSVDGGMHT
ncbi:MAG: 3-oxoacyl-[acyl-carrier-protein] reductase [Phycisphaerae bacterium]|jgi:3-oxoacyl-[acyl-carrier protein] reductase|nr:3-oxoacyl-[acyl-carrier-protein] reductase [Phycisphaerae bacterium]